MPPISIPTLAQLPIGDEQLAKYSKVWPTGPPIPQIPYTYLTKGLKSNTLHLLYCEQLTRWNTDTFQSTE